MNTARGTIMTALFSAMLTVGGIGCCIVMVRVDASDHFDIHGNTARLSDMSARLETKDGAQRKPVTVDTPMGVDTTPVDAPAGSNKYGRADCLKPVPR